MAKRNKSTKLAIKMNQKLEENKSLIKKKIQDLKLRVSVSRQQKNFC